jgi:hypothetical protein
MFFQKRNSVICEVEYARRLVVEEVREETPGFSCVLVALWAGFASFAGAEMVASPIGISTAQFGLIGTFRNFDGRLRHARVRGGVKPEHFLILPLFGLTESKTWTDSRLARCHMVTREVEQGDTGIAKHCAARCRPSVGFYPVDWGKEGLKNPIVLVE